MNWILPAAALAATLPLLARAADPADPAAPVPPAVYRSAFAGVPTGVEQDTVPWRQANETVGQFPRGHSDVLKWERAHPGATAPAPAASDAPAAMPHGHEPQR